ncbi:hypothetical protein [Anaerophaga thermohalophila]|uniref:hypothetical protein n=1 Tax=Anaerophaga thermohalophila TaxID=177400 RepID=UPI000237C655|nr:hypothetical protein [Anaerophaga thermohalophila]
MKAYKFDTKISENGAILLPLNPNLYNKEVEIIIVPKTKPEKTRIHKASDFVNKWAGFLTNSETDNSKFNYLSEKYR